MLFNDVVEFPGFCSVVGRIINEYGALREWPWQMKTDVLFDSHTIHHKSHVGRPGSELCPSRWRAMSASLLAQTQFNHDLLHGSVPLSRHKHATNRHATSSLKFKFGDAPRRILEEAICGHACELQTAISATRQTFCTSLLNVYTR